jgi:TusA-related sulfurtransferase
MTAGPSAQATRELDCLGKACPVPVIELAKAMADMAAGDVIVVRSDDPGAKVDIPVWCRMKGQELVAADEAGSELRFTVRKTR